MTERRAIDYAWQHPAPAAIKAGGYEGVARYISHSPDKDITVAEANALHAQGLNIWLVWETTANRAGQGGAAGTQDVRDAEAKATALGYPTNVPIFYAVDFDANPQMVMPYFAAVAKAAKRPVGVYGSLRVVEAVMKAGYAEYGWQTAAWSGGKLSQMAHVYQRVHPNGKIPGYTSGWDENVICRDFPVWTPKPAPAPKPPAPAPAPAPTGPTRVTRARTLLHQSITSTEQALALCVASKRPRALAASVVLRRVVKLLQRALATLPPA